MAVITGTVQIGYNYGLKTPVPIDARTKVYSKNDLIDKTKWSYAEEFFTGLPVWVDNSTNADENGMYILSALRGKDVNLVDISSASPTQKENAWACWTKLPSQKYVDDLVASLGRILRFVDVITPESTSETIKQGVARYRTTHTDYHTQVGDVFIFGTKEYVCTSYPTPETWTEIGDEANVVTSIGGKTGAITLDASATTDGSVLLAIDASGKITGTVYGYSKKMDNIGTGHENNISVFDANGYVKDSSVIISTTVSNDDYNVPTGKAIQTKLDKKISSLDTSTAKNHIATFDSSGYVKDSSYVISNTVSDSSYNLPTGHAVYSELQTVDSSKMDKVPDASSHVVLFDPSGNAADSSYILSNEFADASYTLVSGHAIQGELDKKINRLNTTDASNHIAIFDTSGAVQDSSIVVSNESLTDSSYTVPTSHAINLELEELRLLAYAGL